MLTTLLGLFAALCTTLAFVPQLLRTLRLRDTRALSLPMYGIFTTGVLLWLVYGLLRGDWPIILANAVTLVLTTVLLACKWRWG